MQFATCKVIYNWQEISSLLPESLMVEKWRGTDCLTGNQISVQIIEEYFFV